ncbi:MAG: serine hydrolase domain-containing protein [Candidatus Aminicenantales bacterium]
MKPVKLLIIFIILIVFIGSFNQLAQAESLTDEVDKIFSEWDRPDSPGCALGVIKDGRFIYKRGYGSANLEYNIPITSKTIFRIGSTSKQFTAMCVALLEEEGRLSFDDDIRKYLPELPQYGVPLTINHLLHHTSGLRDYLTLMDLAGARADDFYVDGEVVALLARQKELNFKPGDDYLYSNSGYFLLSEIVKRITGKSMRFYADERIFKPLGMRNTHFHDDHTMIVKNRASGYSPRENGGFRIDMTNLDMIGDGGVFTCVDDLFFWDQNFYHNKLGRGDQSLIRKMLTCGYLNSGKKLDYAMGLVVNQYRGLKMISHGGAFAGFRAQFIRFPDQHFSVIVLANLSTINPTKLARKVADIYLADVFPKKPKIPRGKHQFIKLSEAKLREKEGAYYNKKTDNIWRVFFKEGKLEVDTSFYKFQVMPLSETNFLAVKAPVELEIEFKKESAERRKLMIVHQEGEEPLIFEAIELESPTLVQLQDYTGDYFSPELEVTYKIILKEGKLYLRHQNPYKNYPHKPLLPTLKDRFLVAGLHLRFFRDEHNKVVYATMNAGRVKNIRFNKQ